LAIEAVRRIDAIFDVEREINGLLAVQRHTIRQTQVAPLVTSLEQWMRAERGRLSRHADVAKAMSYMLKRWDAFTRFLDDGRICLTVEKPQTSSSSSFLWLLTPRCHHSLVGSLVIHLLVSDFLNPIVPAGTGFAILSRCASLQRNLAELHRGKRRSGKVVLRISRQHVPDHHSQFARCCYGRGCGATFTLNSDKKTARSGPGAVFADQAASTSILRASPLPCLEMRP
jgi:hypothetical protein